MRRGALGVVEGPERPKLLAMRNATEDEVLVLECLLRVLDRYQEAKNTGDVVLAGHGGHHFLVQVPHHSRQVTQVHVLHVVAVVALCTVHVEGHAHRLPCHFATLHRIRHHVGRAKAMTVHVDLGLLAAPARVLRNPGLVVLHSLIHAAAVIGEAFHFATVAPVKDAAALAGFHRSSLKLAQGGLRRQAWVPLWLRQDATVLDPQGVFQALRLIAVHCISALNPCGDGLRRRRGIFRESLARQHPRRLRGRLRHSSGQAGLLRGHGRQLARLLLGEAKGGCLLRGRRARRSRLVRRGGALPMHPLGGGQACCNCLLR
mmetsp:Transcript_101115/g.241004  ORF Transcript_101115/g.241004 Transcript_101115/m.241004 type:complete len:317 (-) Transcript_101115:516-1466(-)